MANAAPRRIVSFELQEPEYGTLRQDAADRGLDSIHQRVREIVVDYLSNQSAEEVLERIGAMEQEVAGLKELLAHLMTLIQRLGFAVIVASGQDSKEANKWVTQNLPKNP